MEEKEKEVKVKFEIDLDTLKTVGKIEEGKDDPKTNDINIKLADIVKKSFLRITDWVIEFKSLVASNKHIEAFQLFEKNKGTLDFLNEPILDDLLCLNKTSLSKDQRKDLGLIIIVIANKEHKFEKIESEIDSLLREFENEFEPGLRQSLVLSKANSAAANGKHNVANNYYRKVLDNKDTTVTDQAFAYRGLAMISPFIEDSLKYRNQAIDKFLEAGEKKEAIKDMIYLSGHFEKEDTSASLDLIDKAIKLYDAESNLNKEFSAGLYHRKAGYLHSLGATKDALESIEIACSLRENLIGNEYEKYSSNSVAHLLSQAVKDQDKIKFYSNKLEGLIPNISSPEFKIQLQLHECLEKNLKIEGDFLKEVEESDNRHFRFSAYLHNGTLDSLTLEEKMDWLDRAKLLLDDKEFRNQHYSSLYFTIAEQFRKDRKIEEAKRNYELCLDFNPFNHRAIQNCGAILWESNKWKESLDFFKKQIDRLGESPVLCYAYGRSLFELTMYQEAFNYFRKCKGKVTGVDVNKYIQLCIEKADNIELVEEKGHIENEEPISLRSFQTALEEFARTISTNSRMHFWQNDNGNYKWSSSPEEKGKQYLITALEMKFGKKSIEIIQERVAGAGIIDLYLILRGGTKIVVEIKICGGNYSSSYALSGEDQLIHYINNTQTRIGFLVVFDGRIRDFGVGFKPIQSIGQITIYTVAIEMSPKIDK